MSLKSLPSKSDAFTAYSAISVSQQQGTGQPTVLVPTYDTSPPKHQELKTDTRNPLLRYLNAKRQQQLKELEAMQRSLKEAAKQQQVVVEEQMPERPLKRPKRTRRDP